MKKDRIIKVFFWATLVLIAAAFIASWFFVESPKTARLRRLDQALVNNISTLESAVNTYYAAEKKLPDSLESLRAAKNVYFDSSALVDPETKTPIVYQKLNETDFEFCAKFRASSDTSQTKAGVTAVSYPAYPGDKNHTAGYQCLRGNLWALTTSAAVTK